MSELSLEEKATNADTSEHIRNVVKCLHKIVKELLDRADAHDQTKLVPPEVATFTEFTGKLAASTYGSAEYEGFRKAMGPALAHHYAKNAHHPEFAVRDEQWVSVKGFEGSYEISSYGNIRNADGMLLKQNITPKGYCRIQLSKGDLRKNIFLHRLVAEHFIPNPDNKPEVNHENGDKRDNRVGNLSWVTSSENQEHAYATGLKHGVVKYVVTCEDLGITTYGCTAMEEELRSRGYAKASSAGIWGAINHDCKHIGLEFTGTVFETWMRSPLLGMSLIDLIEMLCDWVSAVRRHKTGDILKSIDLNEKRFSIDPMIVSILKNSVSLFDGV